MTGRDSVSVALLTRNGLATLPAVLEALDHQDTTRALEIIAIDSGSTDGTQDLLKGRAGDLVCVEPGGFNHGLTRNLAIAKASADLVIFLAQDAIPADRGWLEALVAPLEADGRVAGTFARQEPRSDASALTRYYQKLSVAAASEAWMSELASEAEWLGLTPDGRLRRCTFDNVCSCVRRSVCLERPFAVTPIAEDVEWSRDVLRAGYRIAYVPGARVIHSHDRSAGYEYRRTYLLHRRLYELFGLQTIPSWPLAIRAVASSLALHAWCERASPRRWARAAALAVAWPVGQYLGARAAVTGLPLPPWRPGSV